MRIITWNINGVRTLPQYHPWNTLPNYNDILNNLEADIICFQEMKSSRANLSKSVAVPPSYDAFFSFPVRRSGYSGVATYTRATVTPIKAEEGLCGIIQLKPPFCAEERVSKLEAYPQQIIEHEQEGMETQGSELNYKDLDSEGRALVLDFGLFVLINVYCPNDGNGTEERDKYKADFHQVLEARVRGLVDKEGREVIVVGDLNACAAVIDHCEGHLMIARGNAEGLTGDAGFWEKDVRRWLRDWIVNEDETHGYMVDVVRRFWPGRKGMYTCWNTKLSARDSNYGTRIDYILITRGLLPWVKGADIQPQIKGSDHCPVYLDLHDEITDSNGELIKLRDLVGLKEDIRTDKGPPRLASSFWEEHSGKQMLLEKFFGKPTKIPATSSGPPLSQPVECLVGGEESPALAQPVHEQTIDSDSLVTPSCSQTSCTPKSPPTQSPSPSTSQPLKSANSSSSTTVKRKLTADTLTRHSSSKKQKLKKEPERKAGQAKLSTFFAKPKKTSTPSSPVQETTLSDPQIQEVDDEEAPEVDVDADHRLAVLLSSQESAHSIADSAEVKQTWSTLLAPIQPPKCIIHGELTKEWTVMKPGPNKGKKFFICSRPVGPGYDKGRAERPREHVDRQWRCNFFKWSSDVKREMRKAAS